MLSFLALNVFRCFHNSKPQVANSTLTNSAHSSLFGYLPNDSTHGLSSFSYTEPLRDQYSGSIWSSQTGGGPQNFHVSHSQSGVSKGYRHSSQNGARSRATQNGATPGLDDQLFNSNASNQWKAHQNIPIYGVDEMGPLFSKASLETMGSSIDLTSGSDRPGTLASSYSLSSDQSDVLDDTALYTGSTNYNVEFSEFKFVDEEDAIPRNGAFRNALSNGIARHSSHLTPVAHGSPLQMFTTEDNIYTTGAEIMPQTVVSSGVHARDYQQEFAWNSNDSSGHKASSPSFSVSGLSIPMSRRSSALDALPAFNGQSPRYVLPTLRISCIQLNTRIDFRSARKSMISNHSQDGCIQFEADSLDFYEEISFNDRGRRRGETSEVDNVARDHPYYQTAAQGPDGLYHCPWETMDPPCNHKPEKLKCNYEYDLPSYPLIFDTNTNVLANASIPTLSRTGVRFHPVENPASLPQLAFCATSVRPMPCTDTARSPSSAPPRTASVLTPEMASHAIGIFVTT